MSAEYIYNGNVIDFEASGLSSESYPIEVGLVLQDGTIYHSLIRPIESWKHWSDKAEKIHGIRKSDIQRYGKNVTHVCLELNRICGRQTLFSDCWVKDSDWVNKLFEAGAVERTFRLSPIEYCVPDSGLENWGYEKRDVAKEEEMPMHRALSDAYVIKVLMDRKIFGDDSRSTIVEVDDFTSPFVIKTSTHHPIRYIA